MVTLLLLTPLVDWVGDVGVVVGLAVDADLGLILHAVVAKRAGGVVEVEHPVVVVVHVDDEVHGLRGVGVRIDLDGIILDIPVRSETAVGPDCVQDHVEELSGGGVDKVYVLKHVISHVPVRERLDDAHCDDGVIERSCGRGQRFFKVVFRHVLAAMWGWWD